MGTRGVCIPWSAQLSEMQYTLPFGEGVGEFKQCG